MLFMDCVSDRLPGPPKSSVTYCIRAPLTDWLGAHASSYSGAVLDFGCGDRRYEALLTQGGATYTGCDGSWHTRADLVVEDGVVPVEGCELRPRRLYPGT